MSPDCEGYRHIRGTILACLRRNGADVTMRRFDLTARALEEVVIGDRIDEEGRTVASMSDATRRILDRFNTAPRFLEVDNGCAWVSPIGARQWIPT